jgi:uroporphyrinogen decarboxylase
VRCAEDVARLQIDATRPKFARVCEAVARLRAELPRRTALIGFCGAPWTVASYMVEGGGSPDQAQARLWAYRDPVGFGRLIGLLTTAAIELLCAQAAAGADVLQIFDTWAGTLPEAPFRQWVVAPTQHIVAAVRGRHPDVPIIGFPRGAGSRLRPYTAATGVQGVSCDTAVPLADMASLAATGVAVQGNLDPLLLVTGGEPLRAAVVALREELRGKPLICNLGHGVRPETPPEHVAELVALVRSSG